MTPITPTWPPEVRRRVLNRRTPARLHQIAMVLEGTNRRRMLSLAVAGLLAAAGLLAVAGGWSTGAVAAPGSTVGASGRHGGAPPDCAAAPAPGAPAGAMCARRTAPGPTGAAVGW